MLSNGHIIGDGSWDLRVYVTDLQAERQIRVKGDLHIGGVMLKLVNDLEITMDWSDHALWWPARNIWLSHTRRTLDQCGVQADATLHFTPMHKNLRVQLPDLHYLDMRVDFSIKTFSAVIELCKDLHIRHPEELSFCKPLGPENLKYNYKEMPKKKVHEQNGVQSNGHVQADTNTFRAHDGSDGSLDKSTLSCAPVTPHRPPRSSTPVNSPMGQNGTWKRNGFGNDVSNLSDVLDNFNNSLSISPTPNKETRRQLVRPKTLVEKARMNVAWLDSSLSIMEQGVREFDTLCLRFKFYVFYDLNPKYDAIRINQIYEQARWQLVNEEIDCTEEEMLMFAALQLQANQSAMHPQSNHGGINSPADEDDIDAALDELETTLEGSTSNMRVNDITAVPQLHDELRFFKPKKFGIGGFKKYWIACSDLQLFLYKHKSEMIHKALPAYIISLRGCEVTPDVNISQKKYGIKLEVPSSDGMTEMILRCDNEKQYATWLAACRLAAKGRTMADSSYITEMESTLNLLRMQKPGESGACVHITTIDIKPEEYVSPRYLKRLKGKIVQKIIDANMNVSDLSHIEAKMSYIKAWQSLPEYGISLFIIKFMGHKKEELLGVAHNRIMKMDINNGYHLKTWNFNTLKAWNVNWEAQLMMNQFEEENIVFSCLSADCKVVHEFIGGYIFLSMRSKEANQTLNEEMFHKLTGGWA